MAIIEVKDREILRSLDQLSPAGRRAALLKLVDGMERLDRLIERNRPRLEAVCRARGLDVLKLSEDERDALVDEILHERG
ncbi:MAG: hypothetical protein KGO52_02840 [Nitrospirota bacterium]|nr:hypothetical protein [Nitrospirota bacterium]MDE3224823.1 hypothetical protein [Nitrospirota bacterium]MDE3241640.1 hypothetical protein [Nitrospirota bacterium]